MGRSIRESLSPEAGFRNSHLGGVQEINSLLKSSRKKVGMGKPKSFTNQVWEKRVHTMSALAGDFQADNLAPPMAALGP